MNKKEKILFLFLNYDKNIEIIKKYSKQDEEVQNNITFLVRYRGLKREDVIKFIDEIQRTTVRDRVQASQYAREVLSCACNE